MPTIEVDLGDGTTAVWFVDFESADSACDILEGRFGQPDSIRC